MDPYRSFSAIDGFADENGQVNDELPIMGMTFPRDVWLPVLSRIAPFIARRVGS